MKHALFLILIVILVVLVAQALGSCATWRGVQQDVHHVTNPNWR